VSFRTAPSADPESSNFLIILDSRFRGNDVIGRRGIVGSAIWHEFARSFADVTGVANFPLSFEQKKWATEPKETPPMANTY
jgi:hypothetical protein